jgi:hypothetical protein
MARDFLNYVSYSVRSSACTQDYKQITQYTNIRILLHPKIKYYIKLVTSFLILFHLTIMHFILYIIALHSVSPRKAIIFIYISLILYGEDISDKIGLSHMNSCSDSECTKWKGFV